MNRLPLSASRSGRSPSAKFSNGKWERSPSAKFSNGKDTAQPVPRPMMSSDALYPPWHVGQLEPVQPGGSRSPQHDTSSWTSPEITAGPPKDLRIQERIVPQDNQPAAPLPGDIASGTGTDGQYVEDMRRIIARQEALIESQRLEAVRSSIKSNIMRQELEELRVRFRNDHQVRIYVVLGSRLGLASVEPMKGCT